MMPHPGAHLVSRSWLQPTAVQPHPGNTVAQAAQLQCYNPVLGEWVSGCHVPAHMRTFISTSCEAMVRHICVPRPCHMAALDVGVGFAHVKALQEGVKVPEVVVHPVWDASIHELKLEEEHDVEEVRVALWQRDIVEHSEEVGALGGCLIKEAEVGEAAATEVPQLCVDWLVHCSRAWDAHPRMWSMLLGDMLMMHPGCVGRP